MSVVDYLELLKVGAYCAIGALILGIVNLVILTKHLKGPQTPRLDPPPPRPMPAPSPKDVWR